MKYLFTLFLSTLVSVFSASGQYFLNITEPAEPCLPAEFQFEPVAQSSFGALQIDFGDGNPPDIHYTTDPLVYSYSIAGTYTVSILFYDETFAFVESQTYSINTMGYITHSISPLNANSAIGNPINFNSFTNDSNLNVLWDFGDGSTSTQANPSHSYTSAGTYTVTATFQSATCGTVTRNTSVTIQDIEIDIDIPVNCAPAQVNFTATTSNPNIAFYSWVASTGFQSGIVTDNTLSLTFPTIGNATIIVTMYDANQNSIGSVTIPFTIQGDNYTIYTSDLNNMVTLNQPTTFLWLANNVNTPASPTMATWDFGDGNGSTATEPTHTYTNPGVYNVTVVYTQSCGTPATATTTVTVSDVNIVYTPTSSCAPTTITFNYEGTMNAESFIWVIYDNTFDEVFNSGVTTDNFVTFNFPSQGNYYVFCRALDNAILQIGDKLLEVNIEGTSTSTSEVETCGSSYTWTNGNTYTTSGSYTQSLTSIAGCDSTAILELALLPIHELTQDISSCNTYTWSENNQTYTTSGLYSIVLTNSFGCDSTIHLNLQIDQSTSNTLNIIACEEHIENGITYNQSGSYTQMLTNAAGCDSTLTLNITINDPNNTNTQVTACNEFSWNGTVYTSSGTYTYEETMSCVATYTLDLTIIESYSSTINEESCGTYTWNGLTYSQSGTYIYTGTGINGCDSIVTLNLIINDEPIADITIENNSELTASTGDTYQWLDCDNNFSPIDGATSQLFNAPNGNYAVEVSTNGCSAVSSCVHVENSTVSISSQALDKQINIYPNPTSNSFHITGLHEGSSIAIYSISGKSVLELNHSLTSEEINSAAWPKGIYLIVIHDLDTTNTHKLVVQ